MFFEVFELEDLKFQRGGGRLGARAIGTLVGMCVCVHGCVCVAYAQTFCFLAH